MKFVVSKITLMIQSVISTNKQKKNQIHFFFTQCIFSKQQTKIEFIFEFERCYFHWDFCCEMSYKFIYHSKVATISGMVLVSFL